MKEAGIDADALRRLLAVSSASSSPNANEATSKRRHAVSRRKSSQTKSATPKSPSYVIEMDPAIASELKVDTTRKVLHLTPTQVVDDLNRDRAAKFRSKASTKSALGSGAPTSSSSLNSAGSSNTTSATSDGQAQTEDASVRLSLEQQRLQSVAKEMEELAEIKSTWSSQSQADRESQKAASKRSSSSRHPNGPSSSKSAFSINEGVVMTEEQRKAARTELRNALKLPKGLKRKNWSWSKIKRFMVEHGPQLEALHRLNILKRRGKVLRPTRPPPARVLWKRAFLREQALLKRDTDNPGFLPRSIMSDTRKSRIQAQGELPKEEVDFISRYFTSRRTSPRFLALIVLAFLAYEFWLAFNEYYFDEHPEELESDIRRYLSSNGEFTARRAQKLREDHEIQLHRDDDWHGIKKGWMPNAIWRLWMRSKDAKEDVLVFAFSELFSSVRGFLSNANISFFMKHSRFWTDRALDAHLPEHLISSLKSNGMLPEHVASRSRWSLHDALRSFDASTQFMTYGGIAALLHAASENSLMSVEALLLRTTLSSDDKVKYFWSLPEHSISEQLESMVLFCEEKPLLVASTVSALLSCQMGQITPYHQRLLVLILEKLNEPRVTSTALGEKFVFNAAKNFVSHVPSSLAATGKLEDLVEKMHQIVQKSSSQAAGSLPNASLYRFESENVLRDPSLTWLVVSLPISALWITSRYNSNALWNGLGSLPLRLRLAQVASRSVPAVLAAYTWLVYDSYSHRLVDQVWSKSLQPTTEGENGTSKVKYSYAASTYGQGSSKPVSSLAFGTLLGASKSVLLWQFPFIWAPQLISEAFSWPIAKFRQWRFSRLQSQKR